MLALPVSKITLNEFSSLPKENSPVYYVFLKLYSLIVLPDIFSGIDDLLD